MSKKKRKNVKPVQTNESLKIDKTRRREEEDMMILLASIGVPFLADGTPIGIGDGYGAD